MSDPSAIRAAGTVPDTHHAAAPPAPPPQGQPATSAARRTPASARDYPARHASEPATRPSDMTSRPVTARRVAAYRLGFDRLPPRFRDPSADQTLAAAGA